MSLQSLPQTDTYHTQVIVSVYHGDCIRDQDGYNPDRHGSCSGTTMTTGIITRLYRVISAIQEKYPLRGKPAFRPEPAADCMPEFVSLEFRDQLRGGEQGEILHLLNISLDLTGFHIHASFSVKG